MVEGSEICGLSSDAAGDGCEGSSSVAVFAVAESVAEFARCSAVACSAVGEVPGSGRFSWELWDSGSDSLWFPACWVSSLEVTGASEAVGASEVVGASEASEDAGASGDAESAGALSAFLAVFGPLAFLGFDSLGGVGSRTSWTTRVSSV